MKVCELKINDIQSVKDMTHSLLLNKYTVKSTAVYKKYPREDSIDYFKIEVFDDNLPVSNEKEEKNQLTALMRSWKSEEI